MRRFGTVALALAAGYGVIFVLGELLLSGEYTFEPDSLGSGCRRLIAESEADVQPAVAVLGTLFGAWSFALGAAAVLAIPRRLSESVAQAWRLAVGVVIALFSVCFGFVVFFHDGLAIIYLIFAIPVALIIRLSASAFIVLGTRERKGLGKALSDELIHTAIDVFVVIAFLLVAGIALVALFSGPLDAISEVSTC